MKNQQTTARRIQNSIMKSPSPDVANRNIIKDTKTPIDDVKRYLQKSAHSRSPRLSELNKSAQFRENSASQIQLLKMRIKELQFKVMSLTNQNQQYRRLITQKMISQGDINKMRDTVRSYDSSQVVTPKSQDKSHTALAQMQDRVLKLINQNTRLGNLLQQKQNYQKGIDNQVQRLRSEVQYYKSIPKNTNFQNSSVASTTGPQGPDINSIRNYYEGRIQPEMRRSQTEWLNRLRQLSDRMNKIQSNQNYIQRQLGKRTNVITPIKPGPKSPISNKPTDDHNQNSYSGIQLPQSVKPFESMTMRSTIKQQSDFSRQYEDNIRQLENRNRALERQVQLNRRRIYDLQEQIRRSPNFQSFQQNPTDENKYRAIERQNQGNKRRISDLEEQLRRALTPQGFQNTALGSTQPNAIDQNRYRAIQRENQSNKRRIYDLEEQLRRNKDSTIQTLPNQSNTQQAKNKALQRQIQVSKRRIYQLEQQLKRARELPGTQGLPTNQSVEFIKKIRELQQINDSKTLTINNLDRDLRSVRQDLSRLKEKADRQAFFVQNERNTCKKALQQQKQKNFDLEDINSKLNQRMQALQAKVRQKQFGADSLRQQLRLQFDYKQASIKKYYQDLLKNKDKIIAQKLHEYLMMLSSIRKDIQQSSYEQIVSQCQYAINDRNTIQKQIMFIKEQNQKIIMQIKTRLIQQQQRIIEMQKDNQMLRAQVRQLQFQKQKLKKAMLEFDTIKPVSNLNMASSYTTTYKSQQGCKLKACLKQTLKKIDVLQHQITQILME